MLVIQTTLPALPLANAWRVLARRIVGFALHLYEVRWLYHGLLLRFDNLVMIRLTGIHLLVIVTHRRRTRCEFARKRLLLGIQIMR